MTEDIELTWRLLGTGHLTGFEPHAPVETELPQTLRGIWAQRTRWARGQGEVLAPRTHTVFRPWHLSLWPTVRLPAAPALPPGPRNDQQPRSDHHSRAGGHSVRT
ncbi:glycosyltransferase [Streptomyces sp. NPDC051561]|uniref:glycosyltransferase n=1 Tax=Streptomyces sp. NPDC051561 TaxID=3365658 RepID=UPI00379BF97B